MGKIRHFHCKMRASLAQASLELTALLGVFLIVILFYAVFASGLLSHIVVQGDYRDAYSSVQALAGTADSVFSQGEGTVRPVRVVLPVSFNASKSYIGRPPSAQSVPSNTININIGGTDLFANTRAPLSGSFPGTSGEYILSVVSHGTYVSINPYVLDAAPSSIHIHATPGSNRGATLIVSTVSGERTDVNISTSWSFPHANITITPSRFVTTGAAEMPIVLNFTTDPQAYGTHSSRIDITSRRSGGTADDTESISIPITLEVSR
jgi:hypothetical protein